MIIKYLHLFTESKVQYLSYGCTWCCRSILCGHVPNNHVVFLLQVMRHSILQKILVVLCFCVTEVLCDIGYV